MRQKIIRTIRYLVQKQKCFLKPGKVVLVATKINREQQENIRKRLAFYCPGSALIQKTPIKAYFSRSPVLLFGHSHLISSFADIFRYGIYNIDYRTNPLDGWRWCDLAGLCSEKKTDLAHSQKHFIGRVDQLKKESFSKCYLFGTGPSLGKAIEHDWSDGYRVVCNTIVRNKKLWDHINPHVIVAGDAIYHFGHTEHAKQFRIDLKKRLIGSETVFIYPYTFDPIVQRELNECQDQLIPVPVGIHKRIQEDLREHFSLPSLGNVLPHLLLPIGCTLSKKILLWGFDGRALDDKLFWSNSSSESYPELLGTLKEAHPAFFNHSLPRDDPFKYVRDVHGDILDKCMSNAEMEGFQFVMMHNSWTPTLQKRVQSILSVQEL